MLTVTLDVHVLVEGIATQQHIVTRGWVVVKRDFCASWYVFEGAATKLAAVEEDMGVAVAGVVDGGDDKIEKGSILVQHLRRTDSTGVVQELRWEMSVA